MRDYLQQRRKAIAGFIGTAIVTYAAKKGLDIDPVLGALIGGAIVSVIIERIPNKL
jgi:hypothetical protein